MKYKNIIFLSLCMLLYASVHSMEKKEAATVTQQKNVSSSSSWSFMRFLLRCCPVFSGSLPMGHALGKTQ